MSTETLGETGPIRLTRRAVQSWLSATNGASHEQLGAAVEGARFVPQAGRRNTELWRARPKGWDLSISVVREAAAGRGARPVVVALNVRPRRRPKKRSARPHLASLLDALEGASTDGVLDAYDAACDALGRPRCDLGTWLDEEDSC